MIESQDLFIPRDNKSQEISYNNPLFYCFAHKNFYSSDVTCNIPEHWHEEMELLYVSDGEMEYSVNGHRMILHGGEGIFIPPRRIHSNRSPRGSSCAFYCLILHPSYLCVSPYIEKRFVSPLLGPASFDYLLLGSNDWTREIIDHMLLSFDSIHSEEFELSVMKFAFHFMEILSRNIKDNSPAEHVTGQYVTTFKQMLTYITEHYMEKISLEDIADAGSVGKTLCAKIFRKFTDKTPGDYLIHYRITQSMKLLTDSELSITDIAYATGFNSASHYTKTFRELIGCTPNKYKSEPQSTSAFANHY